MTATRSISPQSNTKNQMNSILTPSLLCMEFTRLLSTIFGSMEFSTEPRSFIAGQKQCHVDVLLEPEELTQSLDDVSEKLLMPCAYALADRLKLDGAKVTFHLDLPEHGKRPDLHCSVHRYNGMSVRCLLDEPSYSSGRPEHMRGKYILRFDVLYRNEAAQAAA